MTVKNTSLSKASFVKFRAQSCDFLEVSNPRALLEVALRKFTCLTVGDTICIPHIGGNKFYLDVREVQPNGAASIIETDCNVDFDEPLGYQDSKYAQFERDHKAKSSSRAGSFDCTGNGPTVVRSLQKARAEPSDAEVSAANAFKAFSGNAKRVDGKIPMSVLQAKQSGADQPPLGSVVEQTAQTKENQPAPTYQSKIGDKFSKKKVAVSAFTGTAHKLNP